MTVPNRGSSRHTTLRAAASVWRRRRELACVLRTTPAAALPRAHICTRVSLCLSLHQQAIKEGDRGSMPTAAGRDNALVCGENTTAELKTGHQIRGNSSRSVFTGMIQVVVVGTNHCLRTYVTCYTDLVPLSIPLRSTSMLIKPCIGVSTGGTQCILTLPHIGLQRSCVSAKYLLFLTTHTIILCLTFTRSLYYKKKMEEENISKVGFGLWQTVASCSR